MAWLYQWRSKDDGAGSIQRCELGKTAGRLMTVAGKKLPRTACLGREPTIIGSAERANLVSHMAAMFSEEQRDRQYCGP